MAIVKSFCITIFTFLPKKLTISVQFFLDLSHLSTSPLNEFVHNTFSTVAFHVVKSEHYRYVNEVVLYFLFVLLLRIIYRLNTRFNNYSILLRSIERQHVVQLFFITKCILSVYDYSL